MRRSMTAFTLSLAAIAGPLVAHAQSGPFGFHMGMTMQELRAVGPVTQTSQPGIYLMTTALKPYKDVETYLLLYTPTNGLCKVTAVERNIETSSFGNELQSSFRDLVEAVTSKYGPPSNKFDFLQAGSIWSDPNDWMMGLKVNERVLATYWGGENAAPINRDNISIIAVVANAVSSNAGYLTIGYEFTNAAKCYAELKAAANSAL